MRADEVMKTRVECIRETQPVRDAARRMRDRNIGFIPVCDASGRPIGAVTDRDLAVRVVAQDLDASTPIREVMSTEVIACRSDDDVEEAEQLMGVHHKSRIVVTDRNGKLVGVISLSDLIERDERRAVKTMKEIASREARA